jgi:hypothetical protein
MGDSGVSRREGGSGTLVVVLMVDNVILESIVAHRALCHTSMVVTVGGSCRVASLCDVLSDGGVMEAVQ